MSLAGQAGIPSDVVVLDTDVYSRLYVRQGAAVAAKQDLRDMLVGRLVAIAVQTRAELLIWPQVRGWSADRADRLREQLDNTPTVPVDERVIEAFVRVTVDCRRSGHALAQKDQSPTGGSPPPPSPSVGRCSQPTASTSAHRVLSSCHPGHQTHLTRHAEQDPKPRSG